LAVIELLCARAWDSLNFLLPPYFPYSSPTNAALLTGPGAINLPCFSWRLASNSEFLIIGEFPPQVRESLF
jgi:hypothetical protein